MRYISGFLPLVLLVTAARCSMATPSPTPSITLSSGSIPSGSAIAGAVQFNPPGRSGKILLSSSPQSAVVVPSSLSIAGAASAPFILQANSVAALTNVVVTASTEDGKSSSSTNIVVTPPAVAALTLSTASASSADRLTGTVQLTAPAPAGGTNVVLTVSRAAAICFGLPPDGGNGQDGGRYLLKVDPGMDTASFGGTPLDVGSTTSLIVTATAYGSSKLTSLTIAPAAQLVTTIPAGTPVYVTTPTSPVSSENSKAGDMLTFTVAADVPSELECGDERSRVVVIPKGATVICHIMKAHHSVGFFQKGSLTVEIDGVQAVDGSFLPVHAASCADYSTQGQQKAHFNPTIEDILPPNTMYVKEPKDRHQTFVGPSSPRLQDQKTAEKVPSGAAPPGTLAVIHSRSDKVPLVAAGLTLLGAYGLTTINVKSGTGAVDVVAVGTVLTSSSFNTLFLGAPGTLPLGMTFAVQTSADARVSVKNPRAGL